MVQSGYSENHWASLASSRFPMSLPAPISRRGLGELVSEQVAARSEVTISKPDPGGSML